MKLVSFYDNEKLCFGKLEETNVYKYSGEELLLECIENGFKDKFSTESIDLENIELQPPFTPVRNIFCVGKNYLDHIKEGEKHTPVDNSKLFTYPVFFSKNRFCVNKPNGDIPFDKTITEQVDYEVELAVIIKKEGINISEKEAMDYVFGYSIINDVSARDVQKNHTQWLKGKNLDGYAPFGPCIVEAADIKDIQNLDIKSYVNGELRQSSNTKHMIFPVAKLVSELSKGMKLYPGDIISTGTPAGVGVGFTPPKFLKPGDIVEMQIENIGSFTNKVVE